MAKITDFKSGDRIRRTTYENGMFLLLGESAAYYLTLFDLLATDWEKWKVRKEGYVIIYPNRTMSGIIFPTREDAEKAARYDKVDIAKIEWEE